MVTVMSCVALLGIRIMYLIGNEDIDIYIIRNIYIVIIVFSLVCDLFLWCKLGEVYRRLQKKNRTNKGSLCVCHPLFI